jgi:hypothetical protein
MARESLSKLATRRKLGTGIWVCCNCRSVPKNTPNDDMMKKAVHDTHSSRVSMLFMSWEERSDHQNTDFIFRSVLFFTQK